MLRPGRYCFTFFAVAALCLLVSITIGVRMPLIAGIFALGALYFAGKGIWAMREDPYDLRTLKAIDENPSILEPEETNRNVESKYCPVCDIAYPAISPVCPECGRLGAEN